MLAIAEELKMKILRALSCALLLSGSLVGTAHADDNCKFIVDGLKAQYPAPNFVLLTGLCYWGTPARAENAANFTCLGLLPAGAIKTDKGHRAVMNWVPGLPSVDRETYLDYCAGWKGSAPDADAAEAARKQLETLSGKIKE
ncbi:MAG: hypothetical protein NW223_21020 [Hyphomicrobiaceae bacterium]|nr:hypothetical protein [Hyphomicrobiaceae bacterium]